MKSVDRWCTVCEEEYSGACGIHCPTCNSQSTTPLVRCPDDLPLALATAAHTREMVSA